MVSGERSPHPQLRGSSQDFPQRECLGILAKQVRRGRVGPSARFHPLPVCMDTREDLFHRILQWPMMWRRRGSGCAQTRIDGRRPAAAGGSIGEGRSGRLPLGSPSGAVKLPAGSGPWSPPSVGALAVPEEPQHGARSPVTVGVRGDAGRRSGPEIGALDPGRPGAGAS